MLLNNYSGIRIFFAGDFCSKPSTSLITPSDELKKVLDSCDCRVVNFEVPLKPDIDLPERGSERFFQNDDAPKFLQDLGFNLFTIASNHTFDWGDEGYWKTKAALGDAAFGVGTYDDAYKVKVVEVQGLKIGFYALSFAAYKGVFDDVMNYIPGIVWFMGKTFALVWLLMWIKWTFPRLRIDQILKLEWKYLMPLALINLVVMTVVVALGLYIK
jgi:hypothetical protein